MDGVRPDLDRSLILLLAVTVAGPVMALLDTAIVNVGVERLAVELAAPLPTVQWAATAYLLAIAVAVPVGAWATDRFGGRATFVGALTVFTVGSGLCAAAWSTESLIGFRALQGLGGGALEPTMFTILARASGPERSGRMVGLVGVPLMIGPALGPLVGGAILTGASWRWMFLVNVPIGIVVGLLALRVIPGRADPAAGASAPDGGDARSDVDIIGIGLLAGSFAAFVLSISQAGENGVAAPVVWIALLVGVVLLALYTAHAARLGPRAVVELRMFREHGFAACIGANALQGVMLYPLLFLIPLYFQQARHLGVLAAGALLIPEAFGASAGFRLGGGLSTRVGARWLFPVGCLVYAIAVLPFAVAPADAPLWLLAAAATVAGLGFGTAGGSLLAAFYAGLRARDTSRGSGVLFMASQIGGAVGIAVVTLLLTTAISTGAESAGDGFVNGFSTPFTAVVVVSIVTALLTPLLPRAIRRQSVESRS